MKTEDLGTFIVQEYNNDYDAYQYSIFLAVEFCRLLVYNRNIITNDWRCYYD